MLEFLKEIFPNLITSKWHAFEVVVIFGVIFFQLFYTVNVIRHISKLRKVFSSRLFIKNGFIDKNRIGNTDLDGLKEIQFEDEIDFDGSSEKELSKKNKIKIALIDTNGKKEIISSIRLGINTYLINNYGAAVNFSIIKDIVDREVEVKDEEISQSIGLPLYLGLAATMIGIIFGLFSMPAIDAEGFSVGINALINGVKIAMIGSLTGLACTTYLSSFSYKKAKRIVQKEKNEQLTYLQAKLLPELIKAEDTGVSGLKASLDRFARVATNISGNVLIAANQTGKNLNIQRELITKVGKMKMLKVSKWNLELFDKMDSNMEAFEGFAKYLSVIERMTAQLSEFTSRTADINKVVNSIDKNLDDSKKLMRFLTSHYEKIEGSGYQARNAVGLAQSHFEESIEQLKKATDASIDQLYKDSGNHESKLEEVYKKIDANLNAISSQYIDSFKEAFSQSIPKFEQLDKLSAIDDIKVSVNTIAQSQNIPEKLDSIEKKLDQRSSNSNDNFNQQVVRKLEEISIQLQARKDQSEIKAPKRPNKTTKSKKPKKVGLGKVFKELFK